MLNKNIWIYDRRPLTKRILKKILFWYSKNSLAQETQIPDHLGMICNALMLSVAEFYEIKYIMPLKVKQFVQLAEAAHN